MLTAELTRLNTDLGYFLFRPIKILAVFTACVEFVSGWQHARDYIGRTGLAWIDGQKFPVFHHGKSGNPRFDRIIVMSLWLHFLAHRVGYGQWQ